MTEQGRADAPVVSIITATRNAAEELAKTADSIRRQTYPHIEWIVIDGLSTDDTVSEVGRNADIIAYWVSEPDRGIYDAWNKGCARATGEWVLFIGAGDELATSDAISQCVPHLRGAAGSYELAYGRTEVVAGDGATIVELGCPWSLLAGKWGGSLPLLPPHPSTFHHRSLLDSDRPFNPAFKYAGDSELVTGSVLRRDPLYIPVLVDRMPTGGVSATLANLPAIARERRVIARRLGLRPPLAHLVSWYASVAIQSVGGLLPAGIRRRLRSAIGVPRARHQW